MIVLEIDTLPSPGLTVLSQYDSISTPRPRGSLFPLLSLRALNPRTGSFYGEFPLFFWRTYLFDGYRRPDTIEDRDTLFLFICQIHVPPLLRTPFLEIEIRLHKEVVPLFEN